MGDFSTNPWNMQRPMKPSPGYGQQWHGNQGFGAGMGGGSPINPGGGFGYTGGGLPPMNRPQPQGQFTNQLPELGGGMPPYQPPMGGGMPPMQPPGRGNEGQYPMPQMPQNNSSLSYNPANPRPPGFLGNPIPMPRGGFRGY